MAVPMGLAAAGASVGTPALGPIFLLFSHSGAATGVTDAMGTLGAQSAPRLPAMRSPLQPQLDSLVLRRSLLSRQDARLFQQDTAFRDVGQRAADFFDDFGDLGIELNARLESRVQRLRNDRCTDAQLSIPGNSCRSAPILPEFDFQFSLRSNGVVGDRLHIDVDYDSQREFDASNNLSARYEGKPGERLQRVEVGNVSFELPSSRFITSGIPSGNYGVQAVGQFGPMRLTSIFAQQKGNVSRDNVFMVGQRSEQHVERVIEDVQIESRRFFFTLDPRQLPGYPNVDLLDRTRLLQLAAALPDSIRPVRIQVYRQLIGAANQNPRGPSLSVRGARNPSRQVYELLREHVDYYLDPSMLWIALVRPLSANTERLAIAYEVNVNGSPGRNPNTGGTPDIEFTESPQFANLLWEPELQPSNEAYFLREIKSIYRLGGEDMERESLGLSVVAGVTGDQQKPVDASAGETYLRMFGLAQPTNPGLLDVENRVWPRPNDPNVRLGVGGSSAQQKLIPDYFLVFPSLKPFARSGLVRQAANPANDTLYGYPNEYLYSPQRPQTVYRMMVSYQSQSGGDSQAIRLNTIQIRQNSEHVSIEGRTLTRNLDYEIDYDLGVITFTRPDTLFVRPREVSVRYEENPLFTSTPTTILGLLSQFQLDNGKVSLTAISQRQQSGFNRPPLGYEPTGSLVAGVMSEFQWDATALTSAIGKLPFARSTTPSRIGLQAEFAMSKPQPNAAGQAYIESFEGSADRSLSLLESSWYFSSLPALGLSLAGQGASVFTLPRASSLAYQNNGVDGTGYSPQFTIQQIDPSVRLVGAGVQPFEPLLWMTLYPLRTGGMPGRDPDTDSDRHAWTVGPNSKLGITPTGRRWRSLRTVLNPSGQDLSQTENVEFFVLVNAEEAKLKRNPTLVLDFGEISENSVTFAPETLTVRTAGESGVVADTLFSGKRLVGFDRLDSERDSLSRAFNAVENDRGLAGDVVDTLVVVDRRGTAPLVSMQYNVPICSGSSRGILRLGDNRADCTVRNNRLDEEDIDLDGQLNMPSGSVDQEQLRRFIVDLSDKANWTRTGRCFVQRDSGSGGTTADSLCWVQVRLNWRAPAEELNNPNDRRMRALRLTMVSNENLEDDAFTRIAIARLRLVGAPWLKRSAAPLSGIAGDSAAVMGGYVLASVIGTLDSTTSLDYTSPPGVAELPENRQSGYEAARIQVNEQALRIQAGISGREFRPFDRAEAYMRFPEGTRTFMGYRTLRLWMRGRGNGWGVNGELNGYIKIGRDEHNFYMYRTPVNAGGGQSAWLPEIRVDLTRFQALRAIMETSALRGDTNTLQCSGTDLDLILRSGMPAGGAPRRRAVCDDGYIVYSADPAVTPPNLAAVQELAVGFVRIDSLSRTGTGILGSDTLELWVNDIRLSDVVDDIGFAGEVGVNVLAGDLGDLRFNLSRRDPNFRQLNEAPTFITTNMVNVGTTIHLDRMLPERWGVALPLSIDYSSTGGEQLFLDQTDLRATSIEGVRNPEDRRVSYAVSMRRTSALSKGWYAPIVNGLSLSGLWTSTTSRSTYQDLSNSSYALSAGITLSDDTRSGHWPDFFKRLMDMLPRKLRDSEVFSTFRDQAIRWKPAEFRLSSSLVRFSNSATSFNLAAASLSDTGTVVSALNHNWQNLASLVFKPVRSLSADFTARQVLDLRNYAGPDVFWWTDTTFVSREDRIRAALSERTHFLGRNMGLERERTFTSTFRFQPEISSWLRPRIGFSSSFALNRDPNARTLPLGNEADAGQPATGSSRAVLPKRMGAANSFGAGSSIDLARLIDPSNISLAPMAPDDNRNTGGGSKWREQLASILAPLDIQWQRDLNSNYDQSAYLPGMGYQLGFGGMSVFRGGPARLATLAGEVQRSTISGALNLPLSLRLQGSAEKGSTDTWTLRPLDGQQAVINSDQTIFPNVTLRWGWRPERFKSVVSSLNLDGSFVRTRQETVIPGDNGVIVDRSSLVARRVPLAASVTWSFLGDLTTTVRSSHETREDLRPGAVINGTTDRLSLGFIRSFRLPSSWNTRNGLLRTSASYDSERNLSLIMGTTVQGGSDLPQFSVPTVLTNSGRRAFNLNANTDLSDQLTFTLTGSHVVTFDRAYNRQTTSLIFSTVLQIHFFGGELR